MNYSIISHIVQQNQLTLAAGIWETKSPTYSIYDKDPTSVLINGMMELLDLHERLEIAKRLRRGRRAKAARGGYAGGNAPLGYRRERHSGKFVVDPEMAEVVKHVFGIKKRHRRMTLDEIATSLHEAGYTTTTGRKYHRAQVKRILDNRAFYAGKYAYDGISSDDGQHEIIEGIQELV